MDRELLYPSHWVIFQYNNRKSQLVRYAIYIGLFATLFPILIAYPGVRDHAQTYISEGSPEFNPQFLSYENYTGIIENDGVLFAFDATPQRLRQSQGFGPLTVPLFFTNDESGWLRNLTIYKYWLVTQDVTFDGNQTTIGNFYQSFGSPYVLLPDIYWECGIGIDIYLGITVKDVPYVVGSTNHTILCW